MCTAFGCTSVFWLLRGLMPMANPVHRGRSIATFVSLSILIPSLSWSQTPQAATELYKRFKAGDTAALTALRSAAEAGDADSQFRLGSAYYNGGPNLPKDGAAAAQWIEKAAQQGHVDAQTSLAAFYWYGLGVAKDEQKAVFWWTKAAENGDAKAQLRLGVAFYRGAGGKKDERQALNWFKKAAEQGEVDAMEKLASMYAYGIGTPRDPAEALRWINKPIASGSTEALHIYRDVCSENVKLCVTERTESHSARCDVKDVVIGTKVAALTFASVSELAQGGDASAQNEL